MNDNPENETEDKPKDKPTLKDHFALINFVVTQMGEAILRLLNPTKWGDILREEIEAQENATSPDLEEAAKRAAEKTIAEEKQAEWDALNPQQKNFRKALETQREKDREEAKESPEPDKDSPPPEDKPRSR